MSAAATTTGPDESAVRAAVAGVPDPELPPVTLGMLGMVEAVEVDAATGDVHVELLPTFAGCPATEMMSRDVRAALAEVDGIGEVTIRWRHTPVWSTSRITAEGHDRLRSFGIAPPTGTGPVSDVTSAGRPTLPIAGPGPATTTSSASTGELACPWCGEADAIEEDSPFGPTPCRASWFCAACQQPFERFKPL